MAQRQANSQAKAQAATQTAAAQKKADEEILRQHPGGLGHFSAGIRSLARLDAAKALQMPKADVMSMELTGKTAIVTGAGRGIGEGIALAFAREGKIVVRSRSSTQ